MLDAVSAGYRFMADSYRGLLPWWKVIFYVRDRILERFLLVLVSGYSAGPEHTLKSPIHIPTRVGVVNDDSVQQVLSNST